MFTEAIEDILRDRCGPEVVRAIEAGEAPAALWEAFAGSGFLELMAPEASGGAALPLADLYPIVELLGRYTVPVPLAQAIGARALVGPDVVLPGGLLTLAPAMQRNTDDTITCPSLPFGAVASHVLAADGDRLLLLDCATARREATGIPLDPTATLTWSRESPGEVIEGDAAALQPLGAALHASMLAGAMTRTFEMTLQFCNDRVQFGKSLGKFQAVQHQLSVMAEQVIAAAMAAEAAFQSHARTPPTLLAAIAKARASEAAVFVANTAHALHGAIGVTQEFDLQLLTRRLHSWRMAHGSESYWHQVVGEHVLAGETTLVECLRCAATP